ncbi:hypothetical protein F4810DRAFT_726706 [Camillea tinctor]|nr:hypothetical protein F4810DRAFT_726706 [Camillea tinctor]
MPGNNNLNRRDADATSFITTTTHDRAFTWNTCSDLDEHERIVAKEKALPDGLDNCEKLINTLRNSFQNISNLDAQYAESIWRDNDRKKWIQYYDDIKKRHNDFAVLVGVAGKTGSGKTSALNALLGYRELLPTSNDAAATSVVCKVSYNHDDRLAYAFRACVIFRKKSNLLEQLERFFTELEGRNELEANHNGSIENEDALRIANAAIKTNFEMINAAFGLEENEVDRMSARKLIDSNPDVNALIGEQRWFYGNKADILSEKIKPYLDSTPMAHATFGMKFAAWPPIDEVSRAVGESTSVKLMSDYYEMGIKLDGKFHKKSYCVVLSHIDQIDRAAALRKPEARSNQELQDDIQREGELRAQKTKRDEEKRQATRNIGILQKALRSANAGVQKNKKSGVSKGTHRQDIARLKKLKDELTSEEKSSSKSDGILEIPQNQLTDLGGKIIFTCARARNEYLKSRIGSDFKKRQARMIATNLEDDLRTTYDGEVSIHPISSKASWPCFRREESDKERPLLGFPDISYSGIPSLSNWIRNATILEHEKHAELLLRDLHVCFDLMRLWSRDGWDAKKIGASRDWLENDVLSPVYRSMEAELDSHWEELEEDVKNLNPLTETVESQDECAEKTNETVHRWLYKEPNSKTSSEKIHWLTYQANIQRRGNRLVSRGRNVYTYNWMEDITDVLLDTIVEPWDSVLNHRIPALAGPALKIIDTTWADFLNALNFKIQIAVPELLSHIKGEMSDLESIKQRAEGQMREALRGISRGASDVHPTLMKRTQKKWDKPFEKAVQVTGAGSFRRRQEILRAFAENQGPKMVKDVFSNMSKRLEREFDKLPKGLHKISNFTGQAVETHINMLLDKVLGKPVSAVKLEDVTKLKVHLQQDIQLILLEWEWKWSVPKDDLGIDLKTGNYRFPEEYRCVKMEGDYEEEEEEEEEEEGVMDSDNNENDEDADNGEDSDDSVY